MWSRLGATAEPQQAGWRSPRATSTGAAAGLWAGPGAADARRAGVSPCLSLCEMGVQPCVGVAGDQGSSAVMGTGGEVRGHRERPWEDAVCEKCPAEGTWPASLGTRDLRCAGKAVRDKESFFIPSQTTLSVVAVTGLCTGGMSGCAGGSGGSRTCQGRLGSAARGSSDQTTLLVCHREAGVL